jgi:pimeloyl-ACP methyl ester carboxylesterase
MRHNLAMHMLHDSEHIDACVRTRFRSKELSQVGGLRTSLAKHDAETFVVWGEHDVTADPKAANRILMEASSGLQTHIVPAAGHWVQYERANEINRLLLAWLGADREK